MHHSRDRDLEPDNRPLIQAFSMYRWRSYIPKHWFCMILLGPIFSHYRRQYHFHSMVRTARCSALTRYRFRLCIWATDWCRSLLGSRCRCHQKWVELHTMPQCQSVNRPRQHHPNYLQRCYIAKTQSSLPLEWRTSNCHCQDTPRLHQTARWQVRQWELSRCWLLVHIDKT